MRALRSLPTQDSENNRSLLDCAGIALAPSAKPETNPKPLDVFFFGSNLFLGDGRLNKPPERKRAKAIRKACAHGLRPARGAKLRQGRYRRPCRQAGACEWLLTT